MDFIEQPALRVQTEQRRHAPAASRVIACPFGRGGRFSDPGPHGPMELRIEATDGGGAIAAWLDDGWWADALQRWGDDPVTLTIEPTRDSLLHPVVVHQLEMVRRIAPNWRIVGVACPDGVPDDAAVQALVGGPYHEVRFMDAARTARPSGGQADDTRTVPELLARIRRELERQGLSTPILVRIPVPEASPLAGGAVSREPGTLRGT